MDVQARYGCALCDATLLLATDSALRHPHTLSAALACVRQLREAMQLALPADALYWLVHNGTVHIFRLTAPLLTAGYAAEVRATRPSHPLCTGWCTTARSIFSASPHQGPR
jgi:hypothetical protein